MKVSHFAAAAVLLTAAGIPMLVCSQLKRRPQAPPPLSPLAECMMGGELGTEVSGRMVALCCSWAKGVEVDSNLKKGTMNTTEWFYVVNNFALVLEELREYTDARDNLSKTGVLGWIGVSASKYKGQWNWFERDEEGDLHLWLPRARAIGESDLDRLAASFLEEYETTVETYWKVDVRNSRIPGYCDMRRSVRFEDLSRREFAAALRELDETLYVYGWVFNRKEYPTVILVKDLRSTEKEDFAGMYSSGCILIDVEQGLPAVYHHELGHLYFESFNLYDIWKYPGRYRGWWNYRSDYKNPKVRARGQASPYGGVSQDEDFAEIVEAMMGDDCEGLLDKAREDPVLARKVVFAARLYSRIASTNKAGTMDDKVDSSEWDEDWWLEKCGVDLRYGVWE